VVPGVPRYHNPQCLLIRFMGEGDLDKMTLGAAREAGCTPCRACLPDQAEENSELDPPGFRRSWPEWRLTPSAPFPARLCAGVSGSMCRCTSSYWHDGPSTSYMLERGRSGSPNV